MDIELYLERVEQYAQGAMPEAERLVFEAELATNTELREALELYQLSEEVIEQGVAAQLRKQMQSWSDSDNAAPTLTASKVNMRSMWIRLAAAASVALVLGWFSVQWVSKGYSDEALFSAQYEAPSSGTFRGGATTENPLEPGFKALENNSLQAAEDFFKTITPDQERYAEAQFYLGHTANQLGHYELAINAFKTCIQRNEAKFREKAEWNLVLSYVAAKQTGSVDFNTLLHSIANDPNHSFQKKAVELQGKLGSFWRNISG